jgi:hypothetical protein
MASWILAARTPWHLRRSTIAERGRLEDGAARDAAVLHCWWSSAAFQTGASELDDLRAALPAGGFGE